mmetsp:Transcript_24470/g.73247  ORF Transcript_24470/g.73247 Transcript_24470/m.73247 type:complete len:215 (+) Transcript_24470:22-666(+)
MAAAAAAAPKALKPTRSSAAAQDGPWNPDKDYCADGAGLEGVGEVVELAFHTLTCKDRVERFIAIRLKVSVAYATAVDKYGCDKPLDPKDYATSDRVFKMDELAKRVAIPADIRSGSEDDLHPAAPGVVEMWCGAETNARKLLVGEEIQFKTNNDSFLIKSFVLSKVGSYEGREGGQVMAEMSQLASGISNTKLEQDEMEGVDDDEWDDDEDDD